MTETVRQGHRDNADTVQQQRHGVRQGYRDTVPRQSDRDTETLSHDKGRVRQLQGYLDTVP